MSAIAPRRQERRHPAASIPEVVVGAVLSLGALLTVQLSALTAWIDVFAGPGGPGAQRYDETGRPFTGWSERWHQLGPLLWAAYAVVLLGAVVWLWRVILTRPRAAWRIVPVVVAACAVFWVLNLDRFYLS
jgi:hypothetical protein